MLLKKGNYTVNRSAKQANYLIFFYSNFLKAFHGLSLIDCWGV